MLYYNNMSVNAKVFNPQLEEL